MAFGGAVKLTGESEYRKALTKISQNLKEVSAQMKLTSATFDKNDKSVDALTAKSKDLTAKLELQKSKVEILKNQYKAFAQQSDENKKKNEELKKSYDAEKAKLDEIGRTLGTTSYEYKQQKAVVDGLTQEIKKATAAQDANEKSMSNMRVEILNAETDIKKTEKALDDLNKELAETADDAKKADEQTDNLADGVKNAGDAADKSSGGFTVFKGTLSNLISKGIDVAIQALKDLAKAAVEAWNAFDDGRDAVIRLTGATGATAAELTTVYANVSKSIVADSETIGNAVGEVNTRFALNGDELQELAKKYLMFSEITGGDVVEAIDDTQKALAAYGLGANDAAAFLDTLAATAQKTGVDTSTLTSGLISNATAFQELGLSVSEAVAFMGQLETSGANSETVLNGMRKALKNATKDGKPLSEALKDLQKQIDGATTETEGLQAAYDVFGRSGDQIYGAIKNGTLNFNEIATAAKDASGTIENTFNATKDATDRVQLAIQNLKASVAEQIDNFIQNNGDKVIALMDALTNDSIPKLVDAVIKIGDAIEWVSDHYETIKEVAKGIIDPIILPWKLLFDYSTWAVKSAVEIFEKAAANFKESNEKVKQDFTDLWEKIKQTWSNTVEWFRNVFTGAWNAVTGAWGRAVEWFQGIWDGIKRVFSGVGSFFGGLWTIISTKFSELGTKIGNAISGAVKSGLNGVISQIERVINSGINLINGAINLINKIPGVSIGKLYTLNLPRLAKGAVVDRPTVAQIGENGAEAVIPLENNTKWIRRVAAELQLQNTRMRAEPQTATETQFDRMLGAFKQALSDMKIELDDETAGQFVERTVTRVIYS